MVLTKPARTIDGLCENITGYNIHIVRRWSVLNPITRVYGERRARSFYKRQFMCLSSTRLDSSVVERLAFDARSLNCIGEQDRSEILSRMQELW